MSDEVSYDLGKSYGGWSVGNKVMFIARPKGVRGAQRRWIEGTVWNLARRWGADMAVVHGRDDGQSYDVRLPDLEPADAITLLGQLTDGP